jgi:hypothetical protein
LSRDGFGRASIVTCHHDDLYVLSVKLVDRLFR